MVSATPHKFGIECEITHDGAQVLKLARNLLPSALILDVNMPQLDGFAVLSILKREEKTSGVPVILLTARQQTDDVMRGFGFGADDYVVKPFNPAELAAGVMRLLPRREENSRQEEVSTRSVSELEPHTGKAQARESTAVSTRNRQRLLNGLPGQAEAEAALVAAFGPASDRSWIFAALFVINLTARIVGRSRCASEAAHKSESARLPRCSRSLTVWIAASISSITVRF